MDSGQQIHHKRHGLRQPLDRRVDKWIETGRQLVDGVAGTRPGIRRNNNSTRPSDSSLEKVGRWVGDKLDWFLEEEDGWLEPWQAESKMSSSGEKRPLDAISRRVLKESPLPDKDSQVNDNEEAWPEDSSFRVDKWKRGQINETIASQRLTSSRSESIKSGGRPLPRSNRRR